ncbi:hypothetical protein [Lederbergia citrea]|uniref:hypothetical protein n=1 Tax=Lederbergia citrea TaxID=2833581 RepID=UPI001BC9BFA7|nr:hypothetical protein [Lederbergia citrea]MBS4176925.1 hypothetical protein [Lederbergia citrea]
MKWINEKRVELQSIIDSINGCYTTNNRTGFTFNSGNGVIWEETGRGKKWGKAFEEDNRFYAVIDFPTGSYKINELVERINLDEREEDEQVSGIRLRKDKPFDSVQIAIYDDGSTKYSFNNKAFFNFANEVASKVMLK